MVERGGAVFGIDFADVRDGFVDRFPGDEAGSEFFEKRKTGGEIL